MNPRWDDAAPPPVPMRIGPLDWLRVTRRAVPLIVVLSIGFPLLLVLRVPERAIWGLHRPVTPRITQSVCVAACWFLGLRRHVTGIPARGAVAYVANHISWLDIFVLNASKRLYFVAKAEVQGWSGIGWLARGTGTVFIRRNRSEAAAQTRLFEDRLIAGHQLLFFPEGTSTDGLRMLPFKSTLFAAFFAPRLRDRLSVQPVTLRYTSPAGADPRHYGWWGDMDFGPSLLQILATPRQGHVEVIYHPPMPVRAAGDRKSLARATEMAVRQGLESGRGST